MVERRREDEQRREVVNLERLRDTIESDIHEEVHGPRPAIFTPVRPQGKTALQQIAIAACRLTWREAEQMGSTIQMKMKDGMSLTAAIQAWAADWEKFEDK
jgi:hypothetical protein